MERAQARLTAHRDVLIAIEYKQQVFVQDSALHVHYERLRCAMSTKKQETCRLPTQSAMKCRRLQPTRFASAHMHMLFINSVACAVAVQAVAES
jgi:hypothetical protein